MKILTVFDLNNKKLFAGTRHDCKHFIRKNNVKRFRVKECFEEKVVVIEPTVEPEKVNPLSEPETKEGFFNRVFNLGEN